MNDDIPTGEAEFKREYKTGEVGAYMILPG